MASRTRSALWHSHERWLTPGSGEVQLQTERCDRNRRQVCPDRAEFMGLDTSIARTAANVLRGRPGIKTSNTAS